MDALRHAQAVHHLLHHRGACRVLHGGSGHSGGIGRFFAAWLCGAAQQTRQERTPGRLAERQARQGEGAPPADWLRQAQPLPGGLWALGVAPGAAHPHAAQLTRMRSAMR